MSRDPIYRSAFWRKLRAETLQRDPTCRAPGCDRKSTHADHILPRSRGGTDQLSNLQGLCWSCHSRITATSDGAFGRPIRTERTFDGVKGCLPDGSPRDSEHWWGAPKITSNRPADRHGCQRVKFRR